MVFPNWVWESCAFQSQDSVWGPPSELAAFLRFGECFTEKFFLSEIGESLRRTLHAVHIVGRGIGTSIGFQCLGKGEETQYYLSHAR